MKKIIDLILIAVFVLLLAETTQGQGRPPGIPPKKPKNNHSNGQGPFRPPPGHQGGGIAPLFLPNGFEVDESGSERWFSGSASGNQKNGLNPVVLGSSFLTPSCWGSSGAYVFASFSGTPRINYAERGDFLAQAGFGLGDARRNVSFTGIVNMNDVSSFDNFSASFIASRQLGKLSSISVGALHLFADPYKTDAGESFYIAYSQAIRKTKFSYTVGVGSGRFYDNSDLDIKAGKAEHGTAVFANVSYNIWRNFGVSAEWTGRNLALSGTIMIKPYLPVLAVGVTDLTSYSGDGRPVFFASLGQAFMLSRRR